MASDPYAIYWRLLDGEQLTVSPNEPLCGFWHVQELDRDTGNKRRVAAAVYLDGENIVCIYDGKLFGRDKAVSIVGFSIAVPEKTYRDVVERGLPWPDIDERVHAVRVERAQAGIGHNNPPVALDAWLKDELEKLTINIERYDEIPDKAAADKASSLVDEIRKITNRAKKEHETEKRPYLEKCKETDAKWNPRIVRPGEAAAERINRGIGKFRTRERNAALAKQAAEQQQREAEAARLRRQAEEAAQRDATLNFVAPEPEPVVPPVAPTFDPIRGGGGPKRRERLAKDPVVNDWAAALAHFQADEDLRKRALVLIRAELNAGRDVPGVEFEEIVKVA